MTDKEIEEFLLNLLKGFSDCIGTPSREEKDMGIAKLRTFAKLYELGQRVVLERPFTL